MELNHLEVRHDGAEASRVEKTAVVAESHVAVEVLHVCPQELGDHNCGSCAKCSRTMMTLDVFGKLGFTRTFPSDSGYLSRVPKIYVPAPWSRDLSIVRAIDGGLRFSALVDGFRPMARWLGGEPVVRWGRKVIG